jgi:hypothetical protein
MGLFGRSLEGPLGRELGRSVVVANFGRPGNGPCCSVLTWRRLRRDGIRPDLLVVELVPTFLSVEKAGTDLNPIQYPEPTLCLADLDVVELYAGDRRPNVRRDWWLELPSDLYERRLDLMSRVAPGLVPLERRVHPGLVAEDYPENPNDAPSPERRRRALEHAAGHASMLSRFRLGGVNCQAVRDLLADCRREGIPTALLLMPEGPTYRSWYAPGATEQVRRWLDELQTEFGVAVIDAQEWMEEDDFLDSHHLTRAGARRFTQRLGEERLLPLLRALP